MSIQPISLGAAKESLGGVIPGARELFPNPIGEAAKAAGFHIELFYIYDKYQNRTDESLLQELLTHAAKYLEGQCVVVPDEVFGKGATPLTMEPSDLSEFVETFPHMVFDGDLVIICPSKSAVVVYMAEGNDNVAIIFHR